LYAILDIETTGGQYNEEGITEIAVHKYDGHDIIDTFISLVNPEREIQPFVVNLTGINKNMLRNAPKFYEIAKRLIEITTDCILVAHNTEFDYRILRTEFSRLGFNYVRRSLCTVELSKKLIPDLKSYKLGRLCRSLGIPVTDRHRANGDAIATIQLFQYLLDKDLKKTIVKETIKQIQERYRDPKLKPILDNVPNTTGVYYLHNVSGDIIYIGYSKNIKKRINQHFTNTSRKAKKIQTQLTAVTFEKTGSELIALLKANQEIKKNKPIYNSTSKKAFTHAMYSFKDENGYINLKIDKSDSRKSILTTFTNFQSAKSYMFRVVEHYNLCQKLTGLDNSQNKCFNYSINSCYGACINKELPENYNKRVKQLVLDECLQNKSILIIDKGREINENTAILIEDGIFKGFGFFNLNFQINNFDILKSIITPMDNNNDVQHILNINFRRNKKLKIIQL
jgi:DNA polymerase-3 subunit epsilon